MKRKTTLSLIEDLKDSALRMKRLAKELSRRKPNKDGLALTLLMQLIAAYMLDPAGASELLASLDEEVLDYRISLLNEER